MADSPYLIALALLEQDGNRVMPLQGKSLSAAIPADGDPGELGQQQALALLLRIWQRSDSGPLARANGAHSLLLLQVPIEALQLELPQCKADWLNGGSTEALLVGLKAVASSIWSLAVEPRGPISLTRLH